MKERSCPDNCDPRICRRIRLQIISERLAELGNVLEREEDTKQRVEQIIRNISEELIDLQALPSVEERSPTDNPDRNLSQRLTSMSIEGSKVLTGMLTISVETNVAPAFTEEDNNISTDMLITSRENDVAPESESTETGVADSPTTLRSPRAEELIEPLSKLLRHMLLG